MTGAELRKRRDDLGLTQAEIATAFGIDPNTWARWERGAQPMRFPLVLRFLLVELAHDRPRFHSPDDWRQYVATRMEHEE